MSRLVASPTTPNDPRSAVTRPIRSGEHSSSVAAVRSASVISGRTSSASASRSWATSAAAITRAISGRRVSMGVCSSVTAAERNAVR